MPSFFAKGSPLIYKDPGKGCCMAIRWRVWEGCVLIPRKCKLTIIKLLKQFLSIPSSTEYPGGGDDILLSRGGNFDQEEDDTPPLYIYLRG